VSTPEKRIIDVDAARAARAAKTEKQAGPPELVIGGDTYILPGELPAEAVHAFGAIMGGDFSGLAYGMACLFGGEDEWATMLRVQREKGTPFSFEDELYILEAAFDAYGMTLPESPASPSS
jgi:hypothetical protein